MNKKTLMSLAASLLVLAACGGGGGGDDGSPATNNPPPVTQMPDPVADTPPDSASQTAEGLTAYLETLAGASSDTAEALDLSKFLPPKSETAEPTPVS